MLIEFSASNFRSILHKQILSMVPATNQSDYPENIILQDKHQALNVVALYGPNNSGKTTLIQAFHLLHHIILSSAKTNSTDKLPFEPNLLVEGFHDHPTELEVVFLLDRTRYRYGFSFNQNRILGEWLFRKKTSREVELFVREKDIIDISSGLKGAKRLIDTAVEATKSNALFLSWGDVFNIDELSSVFQWLTSNLILDGLDTSQAGRVTENFLSKHPDFISEINKYVSKLDLGIERLSLSVPQEDGQQFVLAAHALRDKTGKILDKEVHWKLIDAESSGTQKIFEILAPIIFVLAYGRIILIDEIEAKLHTKITSTLVDLFINKKTNPKNSQLIFATHDTNLLKYSKLRRDQIYFVEKDISNTTTLYSLSDFRYFKGNKERPDTDKEKRYLEGRYGATPNIKLKEETLAN